MSVESNQTPVLSCGIPKDEGITFEIQQVVPLPAYLLLVFMRLLGEHEKFKKISEHFVNTFEKEPQAILFVRGLTLGNGETLDDMFKQLYQKFFDETLFKISYFIVEPSDKPATFSEIYDLPDTEILTQLRTWFVQFGSANTVKSRGNRSAIVKNSLIGKLSNPSDNDVSYHYEYSSGKKLTSDEVNEHLAKNLEMLELYKELL